MNTEITLTTSTRAAVEAKTNELVTAVTNGDVNALQAWVYLIALENLSKGAKKEIETAAIQAAAMYGEKTFNAYGASVTLKEAGVRYDYSGCGDAEYNMICDNIAALEAQKKSLEKVMLAHKEVWVKTDMETGETYEVLPPVRTAKESLAITLNK